MAIGPSHTMTRLKVSKSPNQELMPDVQAAQDKMDAAIGWFADPIYLGQYPESLSRMLGDRLPVFTADEQALVKGSSDVSAMTAAVDGRKRRTAADGLVLRNERTPYPIVIADLVALHL